MKNDNYFTENNIKELFLKYKYFNRNNKSMLSIEENKEIILNILEEMNLPNFISSYPLNIYNQYLLNTLSIFLWNSISTSLRKFLLKKDISPKSEMLWKAKKLIKARILGKEGYYPNQELVKNKNIYSFRNGIPILITNEIGKDYLINSSEVSFLNVCELRFAASVNLTQNSPYSTFYFNDLYVIHLDERALIGLNNNDIITLLVELLLIKGRGNDFISSFPINDSYLSSFQFNNFSNTKDFNNIYDNIDDKDQLLLRTLFYFIKSSMLMTNHCFGEDAVSNVLFSLEGALLLMQRKNGYSEKNININALTEIFLNTFNKGEELFEFIQEGYAKRISIVHANPKNGVEWSPFLMADDYCEYYDISRMLLNYIIIDKIIEL